jgi:uridine kinase
MHEDPGNNLSEIILKKFYAHTHDHVFTVAISGIDASGKGYVAKHVENRLKRDGLRVANINMDPWQNPIPVRLSNEDPAENFYQNVFRWNDVFDQLIVPLRKNKGIWLSSRLIATHADEYFNFEFNYRDIDILLVEAIFLFQQKHLEHYDHKIWITKGIERCHLL